MKKLLFILFMALTSRANAFIPFNSHSWMTEDGQIKLIISDDLLTVATNDYSCEFDVVFNQSSFYGTLQISRGRTVSGQVSHCRSLENVYPFITNDDTAFLVINTQDFNVFKLKKLESTPTPVDPPQHPTNFTYDEIIPDVFSSFVQLRPGGSSLINSHVDPRTGGSGLPFPRHWNTILPGQSVRLKILIPPGVSMVGWRIEAPDLVAHFGVCDEKKQCSVDKSYPPTIFPFGYNSNLPDAIPVPNLPALNQPRVGYLTVKALSVNFTFFALAVNYVVKDAQMYEAWRSKRSWAGGPGDCDGLGGEFCR